MIDCWKLYTMDEVRKYAKHPNIVEERFWTRFNERDLVDGRRIGTEITGFALADAYNYGQFGEPQWYSLEHMTANPAREEDETTNIGYSSPAPIPYQTLRTGYARIDTTATVEEYTADYNTIHADTPIDENIGDDFPVPNPYPVGQEV